MADINDALIRKVAELSRLKLEEAEIAACVTSMGEILNHVNQLAQVNTEGVEPMFHGVDDFLRFREDRVREFPADEDGRPGILRGAPSIEDGGFKVPQIVG